MPGLVHVVDDDAAFRAAIERRLKQAGYEVATYASAERLLDRLPSETSQLRSPRCADTGIERTRTPPSPARAWLNASNRFSHGSYRYSNRGESHQGGRCGFSTQTRIVG